MIENIIQTQNGYRATINGKEWTIPDDPGNLDWKMVRDAIVEGASVTVEQAPPAPVPDLSFAQLLIGLVSEGWITEVEGTAWLEGTLPFAVSLVIDTLPTNQQFAAKARAIRPSEIIRDDPLVSALAVAQGKTPEEIDDFFLTYSRV